MPALVVSAALAASPCVGQSTSSASDQESALIQVLRSDAPGDEKAIACKKLAIYGSETAVPALAPLLADERFASWARIALEAIPGSAPDNALRKAAGNLHGRLLVGVINSIGVRRDAKSVSVLTRKLKDSDPEVASAAAVALGKIGGKQAASALRRSLQNAPEAVRPAIAEGCVRCAENFLAVEKRADAVQLYDAVLTASVPEERTLEAIRGAILARGSAGIPLLLEQLQSNDRSRFNIGLRVARELPGQQATEAVAGAFRAATPDRQPLLLMALADRGDSVASSIVMQAAGNGEKNVRRAAIDILDRSGDASGLPVLLVNATDDDPEISQPSLAALARLAGNDVDSELCARLADASGRMRQALIIVAARRGIEKALPLIVRSVGDPDAATRGAAIQALTALGGNNEVAELARALQKSTVAAERAHIEKVLVTLSGRLGTSCVPSLLPLIQSAEPENRVAGLHALVAAGGSDALAAVVAAIGDKDPSCQDEAVRTLSTWPNAWPEDEAVAEPLLHVAKTETNSSHGILALRGYLQFLLGDEKLKQDDKLAKVQEIIPLLQRPEEKITAMAVLQGIHNPAALELLASFTSEPAVADAACVALVQAATQNKPSFSLDQRQKVLQLAFQKSTNEDTKHKAEEALKNLQ
ncbi:MAG TPA: HEAT repeat domain-containing protein [Verrucomicrobiae bacterium]|nr:HEAT repeat domain-containing protein [Verrucomicrobiae bacterium]